MNYFETYPPVVTWFAIKLMIIFRIISVGPFDKWTLLWHIHKLQWIQTKHGTSKETCFEAREEHLCPETGWVCVELIPRGQTHIHSIHMSLLDDCVFFCDDIIFMVYVDDGIFLGSNNLQLQEVIKEIQDLGLSIQDQGHQADYVGFNIRKLKDGLYEFTQQALIDFIINDIKFKDTKVKTSPSKSVTITPRI